MVHITLDESEYSQLLDALDIAIMSNDATIQPMDDMLEMHKSLVNLKNSIREQKGNK